MPETFLFSDPHFDHANILTFKDYAGNPLRPFSTVDEMNQAMVDNWNSVVKEQDTVYVLGDVAFNNKGLRFIGELVGNKKLIRGNHDTLALKYYTRYFSQIHGAKVFPIPEQYGGGGFIATHIPIHEQSLARFRANVHGHLHANIILRSDNLTPRYGFSVPDERYINVCVEKTDFTPIPLYKIYERIHKTCL